MLGIKLRITFITTSINTKQLSLGILNSYHIIKNKL